MHLATCPAFVLRAWLRHCCSDKKVDTLEGSSQSLTRDKASVAVMTLHLIRRLRGVVIQA